MTFPPQLHPEPCRICGGGLAPRFEGEVLGHIPVIYHRCRDCASLLLPAPHWLEEAYRKVIVPDPDQGALSRSGFIHRVIRRLRSRGIRLVPRHGRTLDVGCGKGLLLRLLLDDGMDAWGHDPYPQSIFAQDRLLPELPSRGDFDLVTLVEVLEHTLDPVPTLDRLRRCLGPKGLLMVSTELCDPERDDPSWPYLAPEHGQHITCFSPQGLRHAADQAGLDLLASFTWGPQPFLHLLAPKGAHISPLALWLLARRHRLGERRHGKDRLI